MKKTTLSLAISLILAGSFTPVYAEEVYPERQPQESEPTPPEKNQPPIDDNYVPPPAAGDNYAPPLGEEEPPPPPPNGPPPKDFEDFNLDPNEFQSFGPNDINGIDPDAFEAFEPEDLQHLPPDAFAGFNTDQFAKLERDALDGLSDEQFGQLPPEVFADFDPNNIGGFNSAVFNEFTPEHLQQFNPGEFQNTDPRDLHKLIANANPDAISPEDLRDLLPSDWIIEDDGDVLLPPGDGFVLPPFGRDPGLPSNVQLPDDLPNLGKGIGLGGQGKPIIAGLNEALEAANFPQFDIKQDDQGIMQVEGSERFEGVDFSFIPNSSDFEQAPAGTQPGLTQDDNGMFILTTPEGLRIPILPAPKDLEVLRDLIPGNEGEVELGKDGDVTLNIPEQNGQPARCDVGIFDPQIIPAPDGLQPGIHFPDDPAGNQPAIIVYEDGTAQVMHPTVPEPSEFIAKALEFDGVEKTEFNSDGTFDGSYQRQPFKLEPTFVVNNEPLAEGIESFEPTITVTNQGTVEYRFQQGDEIMVVIVNIVTP